MKFDTVFRYTGQYKKYQIVMCLLISVQGMFMGFQNVAINILAYTPDYWCKVDRLENFTYQQQKEISIPYNNEDGEYETCKVYDVNWSAYSDEELLNNSDAITSNASVIECDSWTFDASEFPATAVTEWSLVCGNGWYVSLTSSIFLVGFMIGAAIVGPLADTYGRKSSLFILTGLHGVVQVAAAFSPNVIIFMIVRAMTAALTRATYSIGYTLCLELVGPKFRSLVGQQYQIIQCIGILIFVALSYFIRHFRMLMLAYSIPIILYMLLWFVVPESPRWLCSMGKFKEAKAILERCAKMNGKTVPYNFDITEIGKEEKIEEVKDEGKKEETLKDLLNSPTLRRNIICLIVNFSLGRLITVSAIFGLSLLPGDVFVNMTLLAVFDIPVFMLVAYMVNRFGRITTLEIQYIFTIICMFAAVPFFGIPDLAVMASFLTLLGRSCASGTGSILVMMTAELHPTTLRNKSTGLAQGISLFVTLAGPYISIELANVWDAMPTLIYASVGSVCIFTSMLLPETKGRKLPDTIAEAEMIGTGKMFPWCRKSEKCNNIEAGGEKDNAGFVTDNDDKLQEDTVDNKKRKIFTITKVTEEHDYGQVVHPKDNLSNTKPHDTGCDSAYATFQTLDGDRLKREMRTIEGTSMPGDDVMNVNHGVAMENSTTEGGDSEDEFAESCMRFFGDGPATESTYL